VMLCSAASCMMNEAARQISMPVGFDLLLCTAV